MRKFLYLSIRVVFLVISIIYAGTTGKISGKITDVETGLPLAGVNVVLEGTMIGAATDMDGYFTILNIPPGMYKIGATMIGYAPYYISQVRVEIDLTTNVDIQLKTQILEGETVEVTAKRKVIKKDVAGSQKSITSDEISALPVTTVGEVIGLKAGITSDLSIRGSGSGEVLFMVDGVVLRDNRNNQPITSLPLSAVQEISVQSGGLSAEYTNVRSGVVNVVTKDGGNSYNGSITIKYSPAQQKHFGISPYNPNSFWLYPYLNDELCWEGTARSGLSAYELRQYPSFDGWNKISEQTLQDDDPNNDLTPYAAQRIYKWEHRKDGYIQKPDLNIDYGFGGPVPFIGDIFGNLRFFFSQRTIQNRYLIKLNTNGVYDQSSMLKLTSDINPSTKLTLLGIYSELYATSASRSGGTSYFNSVWGVANAIDRSGHTNTWRLYTHDYWCPTSRFSNTLSAKISHVVNPGTFWEAQVKRTYRKYHTAPGDSRDTSKIHEIFPGTFVDEAPIGFEPIGVFGIDGMAMGGPISTSRDKSKFTTWTARFDYTSQVNFRHQLKTGAEFVYDKYDMDFGSYNSMLPEGNYHSKFERKPYRIMGYVSDKIEYEGFITAIGLVAEYINSNGDWYNPEGLYDRDFFSANYSEEDEEKFKTKKLKPQFYLSPRLAISHPITVNSKLFFNYSHNLQMPTSERLYRIQRAATNKLDYLGDPSLQLARTVAYELGYDHSIFDTYLFHLSAYYKNIDHQEDWTSYYSIDGKVIYSKLSANSYQDIRGLEIEFQKMFGKWLTGNVNYEYRVGTSGYFGVKQYHENPADQREYLRDNPYQSKPIPLPRVKSYIDFHTPFDFGFKIGKQNPLGDWHMTFIARWTEGSWSTWNPKGITGILYNIQYNDYHNIDLKISKVFYFGKTQVKLFADISNLTDHKYWANTGFYDSHDYYDYMYSLHLPKRITDKLGYNCINGNDRPGNYRKKGVEFQPLEWVGSANDIESPIGGVIYYDDGTGEYMEFFDNQWLPVSKSRMDKFLENKAYINMPNQSYFTFLNPRDIFIGLTVSFDFK